MHDKRIGSDTIVCVHGAGAGGWEWGLWARVLTIHGFDVIAPDLMPAAGGLDATRFADYRDQVVAWGRSVSSPILFGASLGGLLALAAVDEIDPVALVLLNPMPPLEMIEGRVETWPAIVPWGRKRSLAGTRRALPGADDAARLYAYRRWRDESGGVLNEARARPVPPAPACPILVLASVDDEEAPFVASRVLAGRLGADFESIAQASHVDPLLGRVASRMAERVCDWLSARSSRFNCDLAPDRYPRAPDPRRRP